MKELISMGQGAIHNALLPGRRAANDRARGTSRG